MSYYYSDGDFKADDAILTFAELGPRHFLYRVDVLDDSIAEGPEELFVNLSAAGDKGVAFHRNAAQLVIVDNDSNIIDSSESHNLPSVQVLVFSRWLYHRRR